MNTARNVSHRNAVVGAREDADGLNKRVFLNPDRMAEEHLQVLLVMQPETATRIGRKLIKWAKLVQS